MQPTGFWRNIFTYLVDPEVSFLKKLWVIAPVFYFLSPLDLIPDPILGIGWLDDLVIILLFLGKIKADLNRYITRKTKPVDDSAKGETIDNVEYKVHKD